MHKSILIFFIVFSVQLSFAQKEAIRHIEENMFIDSMEVYASNYPKIEAIKSLEEPIYIAASYYPNIENTNIKFKEQKMKTTMAARPSIWFLFQKRDNRKYKIIVNSDSINKAPRIIQNMSLNMQVGVIGHEFAHITDYQTMNSLQIIKFGFSYLFKNQRKAIEHRTDSIAIAQGLGWQIYDFSSYINNSKKISKKYKKYKRSIYLRPKQIANIILQQKDKGLN